MKPPTIQEAATCCRCGGFAASSNISGVGRCHVGQVTLVVYGYAGTPISIRSPSNTAATSSSPPSASMYRLRVER